jgi:hypothetical protein
MEFPMAYKPRLLATAAILTGLMALAGGDCDANAATLTTPPVTDTFFVFAATGVTEAVQTPALQFPQFNPSLGTLTSVDFSLTSSISGAAFVLAQFIVNGAQLASAPPLVGGAFDFTMVSGLAPDQGLDTAFYTGSGNIGTGPGQTGVVLELTSTGLGPGGVAWAGNGTGQGLTLVYDYTPATPLPAALPLFATGLGGLGLLGWRRKRKAQAGRVS